MSKRTDYNHGTFSWVDLATTDVDKAKAFYAKIMNWEYSDMPAGDSTYSMANRDGSKAAAIFPQNEQMKQMGMPSVWQSYVTVDDADAMAKRASELGGSVAVEPFDVFESGRMAVIADPTGAVFNLWQPKNDTGAVLVNEPGGFCWNELYTGDVDAARKFYADLFGWTFEESDMGGGMIYTSIKNGEDQNGGLMKITEEMGPIPPHWSVYLTVEDCDAAAETTKELGGEVLMPPTDIPDVGRFCALQDPTGATFCAMELNETA